MKHQTGPKYNTIIVSGRFLDRTGRFLERRFPDKTFPRYDVFPMGLLFYVKIVTERNSWNSPNMQERSSKAARRSYR